MDSPERGAKCKAAGLRLSVPVFPRFLSAAEPLHTVVDPLLAILVVGEAFVVIRDSKLESAAGIYFASAQLRSGSWGSSWPHTGQM